MKKAYTASLGGVAHGSLYDRLQSTARSVQSNAYFTPTAGPTWTRSFTRLDPYRCHLSVTLAYTLTRDKAIKRCSKRINNEATDTGLTEDNRPRMM